MEHLLASLGNPDFSSHISNIVRHGYRILNFIVLLLAKTQKYSSITAFNPVEKKHQQSPVRWEFLKYYTIVQCGFFVTNLPQASPRPFSVWPLQLSEQPSCHGPRCLSSRLDTCLKIQGGSRLAVGFVVVNCDIHFRC